MLHPVVHITKLNLRYGNRVVLDGLDWQIGPGEHWLVGGPSGSGKSVLAKVVAGLEKADGAVTYAFNQQSRLPQKVLYVSNWYQFTNLEGDRNFYYQQRYNKQQKNDTLTVFAELAHYATEENLRLEDVEAYLELLGFSDLKNTQLIELSSGEHKKLQLIKALWLQPQLLIVDEPYTGLDRVSRVRLNRYFDELAEIGVQLVLITTHTDLPQCINRFAEIIHGRLHVVHSAQAFASETCRTHKPLPDFLQEVPDSPAEILFSLENVHVRYGEKLVLNNVSWTVKTGEKWLLQGPNGSGKSTLLSLVTGDHPQAYANHIQLFGQPRGSGESIWDIKKRIGMISPELHWYFDKSAKVWQAIASGLYDSIGLFRQLGYRAQEQVNQLLDFFGLAPYKDHLVKTLPLGMQRLTLLARTIIKNPPLLILDEPCQGLDQVQTNHFNAVVDELCGIGSTLIYVGHYEAELPNCLQKRMVLERGEVKTSEDIRELVY